MLDKPLLEAVGVDAGSEVELSTNGDVMLIELVEDLLHSFRRRRESRTGVITMRRLAE